MNKIVYLWAILSLGTSIIWGQQVSFGRNARQRNSFTSGSFGTTLNNNRRSSSSSSRVTTCVTVGGPNPKANCVFPFKHNGKTYNFCPIDPDDTSKTWCSTLTDQNGNHLTGRGQYGHCGAGCPKQKLNTNRIDSSSRPTGSSRCTTVSGPNTGANCIFPFKHDGKTYNFCPQDPDDSSKTWCSTKVDRNGNHIVNQSQYGHCGPNCPTGRSSGSNGNRGSTNRPTSQQSRPVTLSSFTTQTTQSTCAGGSQCRSIAVCAVRYGESEFKAKTCTQSNGSPGLCCTKLSSSQVRRRSFQVKSNTRGTSNTVISRSVTANAVDVGESFFANVTRFMPRSAPPPRSAAGRHNRLMRAKKGAKKANKMGIVAMEAARQLRRTGRVASNDLLLRGADISSSDLRNCYEAPACSFPGSKYRNIDGSCNNLNQPLYGMLLTPMQRILRNDYADEMNEPRQFSSSTGRVLRSPRSVSTSVTGSNENTSPTFSVLMMTFGQFVDHDITHVPVQENEATGDGINCCTSNGFFVQRSDVACFPIEIPQGDRAFRERCMNFVRSMTGPNLQCAPSSSEQLNQITHWLDSSNVYGSSDEEAQQLRSFQGGRLKGQRTRSSNKEYLPRNPAESDCKGGRGCFLAGDARVNEQPNLAIMHTIFFREHNRVAGDLQRLNPGWNDQRLYQEAKRVVNAEWQHIIFNEYLPILLGQNYMDTFGLWPLNEGFSRDYRSDFDSRITNEFATAAFRVGHTMIPKLVRFMSRGGNQILNEQELSDMFFNVDSIQNGQMDNLIKGMTLMPVEEPENLFTEEVTNKLFDGALNGMDLLALNIQRGRDHGLPSYNEYRAICTLGRARNFDDLDNVSFDNRRKLERAYDTVDDIDLYVGMIMEEPAFNRAFVGATFLCLIGDQFARLKKGDRFFYDLGNQPNSFTSDQLDQIRQTSMARLFCDHSDSLREMQPLAFQLPDNFV